MVAEVLGMRVPRSIGSFTYHVPFTWWNDVGILSLMTKCWQKWTIRVSLSNSKMGLPMMWYKVLVNRSANGLKDGYADQLTDENSGNLSV